MICLVAVRAASLDRGERFRYGYRACAQCSCGHQEDQMSDISEDLMPGSCIVNKVPSLIWNIIHGGHQLLQHGKKACTLHREMWSICIDMW